MNTPLGELRLSVRVLGTLLAEGVETVGDVMSLTETELSRVGNLGPKGIAELRSAIKRLFPRPWWNREWE